MPPSFAQHTHTRTCSPGRCRAGLLWRALPGSRKAAVPGPYMDAGVPARPCGLAVWLTTLLARSSLGETGCWCWCWCCCAWLRGEAGATAVDIRLLLGLCSRPPRAGRQLAAAAGFSSAEWEHSTARSGQGSRESKLRQEPMQACLFTRHEAPPGERCSSSPSAHRHPRQQRAQTPPPGSLRAGLQTQLHVHLRRTLQWRSGCVQHAARRAHTPARHTAATAAGECQHASRRAHGLHQIRPTALACSHECPGRPAAADGTCRSPVQCAPACCCVSVGGAPNPPVRPGPQSCRCLVHPIESVMLRQKLRSLRSGLPAPAFLLAAQSPFVSLQRSQSVSPRHHH
jgi:hypothetical protein